VTDEERECAKWLRKRCEGRFTPEELAKVSDEGLLAQFYGIGNSIETYRKLVAKESTKDK
jgi:hypothetical protein